MSNARKSAGRQAGGDFRRRVSKAPSTTGPDSRLSLAADLDDYRWLIGPDSEAYLNDPAHSAVASLVQLTERLRRKLSPGRAHLVLEQCELRRRAREKYSRADRMFFTRRLLEQATDEAVAAYKAGRFPAGALVAELCSGLGGDLLALAARGPVQAFDRDPLAALLAAANANVTSSASVTVTVADVANVQLEQIAAWHADPDRRPAGRRTTRPDLHEPSESVLHRLLRICPHASIKLAPAAALGEPWWNDAELEWISRGRRCRQLVAWFGDLAEHPGKRRATLVPKRPGDGCEPAATFVGQPDVEVGVVSCVARYVFEPDPAVLAAKLTGSLAAEHGLSAVAPGVAYLTGDRPLEHPALASFEVIEAMPYRPKALKAWLTARGLGRIEIKKRGLRLDPDEIRSELQAPGDAAATVILAPIAGRTTAIVARRLC